MKRYLHPACWLRGLLILAALATLLSRPAQAASKDDLQKQLLMEAPKILDYLREHGYHNVGVLKFRVKKGTDAVSDSVGTLNMLLADELEIALVLKTPPQPDEQVGIIRHASATAAKIREANHLTTEGRTKLFSGKYELAWGKAPVTADAFITGVVQVTADLREMSIGMLVFDPKSESLASVIPPFTAKTDAATLGELGESFVMRGVFDGGQVQLAQDTAVNTAAKVKAKEVSFPIYDPSAPVNLIILYNGQPVPIELRGARGVVREPRENERVQLVLKRTRDDGNRYGCVLKVNGENTLYHERLRDVDCHKWILEPNRKQTVVGGYQLTATEREDFKVLSQYESRKNAMNYGADVGMISLTVFQETKSALPPPDPSDDAADLVAVNTGRLPPPPANIAALQAQLRDEPTRGLIVQGEVTGSGTEVVKFKANPTPVMSVIVSYYRP